MHLAGGHSLEVYRYIRIRQVGIQARFYGNYNLYKVKKFM